MDTPTPSMQDLGRTVSHGVVQHPLSPDEEQTFPQLTQAGSHTDAYLETSPSGLVLASEAEAPIASRSSHRHGSQSTLVSAAQHRKAPDPEKAARADDVKLVTWTPEDPENPRNFPRGKKWVQTLLPTLLCFMAGLSSSLITGGLPEMAEHYKVSEEVIVRLVSLSEPVRSASRLDYKEADPRGRGSLQRPFASVALCLPC